MIERDRGTGDTQREWLGIAWLCNNTHWCDLGQSLSLLSFSEHHLLHLLNKEHD